MNEELFPRVIAEMDRVRKEHRKEKIALDLICLAFKKNRSCSTHPYEVAEAFMAAGIAMKDAKMDGHGQMTKFAERILSGD